jgi:dihydroxyacid dehydratase/phosphogluconate dehydratase
MITVMVKHDRETDTTINYIDDFAEHSCGCFVSDARVQSSIPSASVSAVSVVILRIIGPTSGTGLVPMCCRYDNLALDGWCMHGS